MRRFRDLVRLSLFFILAIAIVAPIIFVARLKQLGKILEAKADALGGGGAGGGGDGGDGGGGGGGGGGGAGDDS